eukprot:4078389-Pleurochrysis_carterae.AAC.2
MSASSRLQHACCPHGQAEYVYVARHLRADASPFCHFYSDAATPSGPASPSPAAVAAIAAADRRRLATAICIPRGAPDFRPRARCLRRRCQRSRPRPASGICALVSARIACPARHQSLPCSCFHSSASALAMCIVRL